jgi:hypothetical protein
MLTAALAVAFALAVGVASRGLPSHRGLRRIPPAAPL